MRRKIWMHNPHAGGTTIPSGVREETQRRIRAYADKRYAGTFSRLDIRFHGALATSMPTSSPSPLHVDSFTFSTRHARSTSTGYARFHSTSVGCDTSAARRSGAWRSTPTATNAMSRAHSPTVPSTALLKRGSKSVPLTCARDQASLALSHGRSGLPNITLQRSGGLALLARRSLSVRVSLRSCAVTALARRRRDTLPLRT